MNEYIETQPNSEKRLIEFAAIQKVAKTKGALYPLTKKWFLAIEYISSVTGADYKTVISTLKGSIYQNLKIILIAIHGVINGVILYEKTASISNLTMPELKSCCP